MIEEDKIQKAAHKIFIESDEDIVFVIEKVRDSENNRVLLITPKHSILTSSIINLKLLVRQLAHHNKLAILVTKNDLALNRSEEINLLAVDKVEHVDNKAWDDAEFMLKNVIEERKQIKETLISARKESISDEPSYSKENYEEKTSDIEKPIYDEPNDEPVLRKKTVRIKPKVVEVGKFKILAGGDIRKHSHLENELKGIKEHKEEIETNLNNDRTNDIYNNDDSINKRRPFHADKTTMDENKEEEREPEVEEPKKTKKKRPSTNSAFIGRDLGSVRSNFKNRKAQNTPEPRSRQIDRSTPKKTKKRGPGFKLPASVKKIVIGLAIFGILFYGSSKLFLKVTIVADAKSESISVVETLTSSVETTQISLEDKKIPLRKITTQSRSVSDTGQATEEKEDGDYAQGVVNFYNKTDKEVTLEAGTQITTLSSNLTYNLQESVKIPARRSELTPSEYENAPIKAASFGDQYNISSEDVKIGAFSTTTELSGRIYRDVKGGTSEKITVVSEGDVNGLKGSLIETLKSLLQNDINNLLSSSDIKIPETESFNEIAFEISPEIGTEAKDFDIVKLEYEMSLLIIDQEDLDEFIDQLVATKFQIKGGGIDSDTAATIENVQVQEDGTVRFDVKKEGEVSSEIDETELFNLIKEQSLADATSSLENSQLVENAEVKFSPFFLPGFMKKIPTDQNKVEIIINE